MSRFRIRPPEEGWLPLALVAFMALTLAWAMDDPGWVNGQPALTDSLPYCALLGVLAGFAGPKLGWGRWTTHAVGALFAGLLIPILAGWAVAPGSSAAQAFHATASGTAEAYLDLAWRGRQFTSQEVHYILVLGGLVWGSAQFAAYAVFGHRRPLNAVVVIGLGLLANMGLTLRDQLPYLVTFTGASLFLLIAMHAFDERTTWLRRRIGDPSQIAGLYLRGGTVFIVGALIGSLFLTQRAASAPLSGAWASMDEQLIKIGETIGRVFPVGGDLRGGGGVSFDSAQIKGQWFSDDGIAFQATVPAGEANLYWRATSSDQFVLTGWQSTAVRDVPTPAESPLLLGTPESPNLGISRQVTVTVMPDGYHGSILLSPATPVQVDRDTTLHLSGPSGWFASADIGGGEYTVTAQVLNLAAGSADSKKPGTVTGNLLRAASEEYPDEITARYTDVPAGALGPAANKLLEAIRGTARSDDPYDLALAAVAYLQDPEHFQYDADIRDQTCNSTSAVECFAQNKRGYCLHYASTMAMLLRAMNPDNPIPTRLVQGFLPGTLQGTTETVRNFNAHAWVEVYFPGYGWVPFDPTGGSVARQSPPVDGPPVASATPGPRSSSSTDDRPDPTRRIGGDAGDLPGGPTTPSQPADRTMLVLITALLAVIVVAVALAAWLRGPRGEISPESAWRTLSRVASGLGFGPRPTQTVYEYAASLGELVPVARQDLQTVAEAKVETDYARMRMGGERLRAVREAARRLRFSLLRLGVRRLRRRRR